jgi:trk system potassium uptake protein TrkH
LGNIGPGLNAVGATQNYAEIPSTGKAILVFFMLLGRLELYTVLVIFSPGFWKK